MNILNPNATVGQAPNPLPLERRRAAYQVIEDQYRHKARLLLLTTEKEIRDAQQAALAAELSRLRAQLWPESLVSGVTP